MAAAAVVHVLKRLWPGGLSYSEHSIYESSNGIVHAYRMGQLPLNMTSAHVYAFIIGDTLIDCGPPSHVHAMKSLVNKHNIRQVLVSHHHEDHSGNAGDLATLPCLKKSVYAPAASIPLLENFPMQWYRKVSFGSMRSAEGRVLAYPSDDIICNSIYNNDGLSLPPITLRPIHAPGHASDHHVIYVPSIGSLFSADLFVTRKPRYARFDQNVALEADTLERILRLDFDTVFCGHRGIVLHGKRALHDRWEFLCELKERAGVMYSEGMHFREIARALLGCTPYDARKGDIHGV